MFEKGAFHSLPALTLEIPFALDPGPEKASQTLTFIGFAETECGQARENFLLPLQDGYTRRELFWGIGSGQRISGHNHEAAILPREESSL